MTDGITSVLFCQRPERMNEKPSVLPAVEVIAAGGSYNPEFFSHQVRRDLLLPSNGAGVCFIEQRTVTC